MVLLLRKEDPMKWAKVVMTIYCLVYIAFIVKQIKEALRDEREFVAWEESI